MMIQYQASTKENKQIMMKGVLALGDLITTTDLSVNNSKHSLLGPFSVETKVPIHLMAWRASLYDRIKLLMILMGRIRKTQFSLYLSAQESRNFKVF